MEADPGEDAYGYHNEHQYQALRTGLAKIGMMPQRATVMFDPAAVRYRRRWEDAQQGDSIIAANEDMRGLVKRATSAVARISALLVVAEYGPQAKYVVDTDVTKRATRLVGWLVRNSVELFNKHILFEEFEKDAQLLMEWIPDEGIPRSELLRYSRKPDSEFERILTTLVKRGDVEMISMQRDGNPRAVPVIRRIYRPVLREIVIADDGQDERTVEEQLGLAG
jgi:hypothetical protein